MSFTFDELSKPLNKAIIALGYNQPTEIQAQAIPTLINKDSDFVGQAQTGTGKTAAFCLPLLQKINSKGKGIQAIILSPTRELANQINQEIIRFSQFMDINTATVYGGVGYKDQIENLKRAHIVIATPGRAIDLLEKGKLKISKAKILVIDEADEMLKMGFIEDVELILENISDEALKWMFSATMPKPIVKLMEKKLDSPEIVRVRKKTLSNENVTQSFLMLYKKDFLKAMKAIVMSEQNFYGIVFCETKEETKTLGQRLAITGKKVVALHGDLNQRQRDEAMEDFKMRRADLLVCTDVGARGLDITEVTHVINMGLPRRLDSYVHRIGRTGRAGNRGQAISLVSPSEKRRLREVEQLINQRLIAYKVPSSEMVKAAVVERELLKMEKLKTAIKEKGKEFKVDGSFQGFKEYLGELSKEQILKLLFSYNLASELRLIDESLENLKSSKPKPGKDSPKKGDRKFPKRRGRSSERRRASSERGGKKTSRSNSRARY